MAPRKDKSVASAHPELDPNPRWVRALQKGLPLLHKVLDEDTDEVTYRAGMVREGDVFQWRTKDELPHWVEELDEDEVREVEREREAQRRLRKKSRPGGTSLNQLAKQGSGIVGAT